MHGVTDETHAADEARPGINGFAAAFLRDLRQRRGMTLVDVSDATGIPAVSLQRYFAGKRVMTIATFDALCEALGTDVVTGWAAAERLRDASEPSV